MMGGARYATLFYQMCSILITSNLTPKEAKHVYEIYNHSA